MIYQHNVTTVILILGSPSKFRRRNEVGIPLGYVGSSSYTSANCRTLCRTSWNYDRNVQKRAGERSWKRSPAIRIGITLRVINFASTLLSAVWFRRKQSRGIFNLNLQWRESRNDEIAIMTSCEFTTPKIHRESRELVSAQSQISRTEIKTPRVTGGFYSPLLSSRTTNTNIWVSYMSLCFNNVRGISTTWRTKK